MKIVIEEFIKTQYVYHDNLKSTEIQFDNVMTEVDHYALETQDSFQGKTADALRETIQTRFGDIHKSYAYIQELMIGAVSDIARTGVDVFGCNGIVDTEVVEEVKVVKQRDINECIDLFEEVNHTLASIDDILSLGRIDTRDLEKLSRTHKIYCDQVIKEVHDYDSYIENEMLYVHESIYEISHKFGISIALTSDFRVSKLTTIGKLKSQEEIFINNMMEMYGFSREESEVMYKVWEGIVDQYPDQEDQYHAWVFTRVIAYIGSYNDWKWDNTAGILPTIFGNRFDAGGEIITIYNLETVFKGLEELGLSESEIRIFHIAVDRQHKMSSLSRKDFLDENGKIKKGEVYDNTYEKYKELYNDPDMTEEEFEKLVISDYNRFEGTGDFSHQMATLSTGLNPGLSLSSDLYTRNKRFISSGYYGDVTDIAEGANLGNDDYIADLDSDNIFRRYEKNKDLFMNVFNDYNSDIVNGDTSRSEEFLKNRGGIEGITKELYGEDMDPGKDTYFFEWDFDVDDVDSAESREASKNFLEALKGGYDTLNEYEASKGK